ncbi:MAG TPA: Mut7-C RNAse domain-containing protein [Desulfobaccales bacterium]|nr:Mut7-C RNAse domain-containing protein [Desulfobaccales bacterium]
MKFLVDQSLGGLAKWLRFCGFDATLMRLAPDKPGNWPPPSPRTRILTRQATAQRLKRPDLMVLAAPDTEGQLQEVLQRLGLSARDLKPLTRCGHCNDLLTPLNRDQVQGRVSEHVFLHHRRFFECPRCHRVYWPGSHLRGITGTLRDQLARLEAGDAEPPQ